MVEAVLGAAALHIDLEGFAPAVGAPLVGVAGDAALVRAHKDTVVVLGVLIEQSLPDKVGDDGAVDLPLLHEVGIHPAHILVGRGQCKGLGRLRFPAAGNGIGAIQEKLHSLLIGHAVVVLDEADRMPTLAAVVVVPLAAPDGNAVVVLQAILPPRVEQLFAALPQQLHQIYGVGPLLLLVGIVDVGSHIFLLKTEDAVSICPRRPFVPDI